MYYFGLGIAVLKDIFGVGAAEGSVSYIVGRHRVSNLCLVLAWILTLGSSLSTMWVQAKFDFSSLDATAALAVQNAPVCAGGGCGASLLADNTKYLNYDFGLGGYHEQRTLQSEGYTDELVTGDCYYSRNTGVDVLNLNINFHNKFGHDDIPLISYKKVETAYFLGLIGGIAGFLTFGFVTVAHMGRMPLHYASWILHLCLPIVLGLQVGSLGVFMSSNANEGLCEAFSEEVTKSCGYGNALGAAIAGIVLVSLAIIAAFWLTPFDAGRGRAVGIRGLRALPDDTIPLTAPGAARRADYTDDESDGARPAVAAIPKAYNTI